MNEAVVLSRLGNPYDTRQSIASIKLRHRYVANLLLRESCGKPKIGDLHGAVEIHEDVI